MTITVITFGTYDLFHWGHLNILKRAHEMGDRLIVGISTDELNFEKKNKNSIVSFKNRQAIVDSIKYVTETFPEESLELKREYIKKYSADILVMGDDWKGKFDSFSDICTVIYLERTPCISTTQLIETISNYTND